MTYPFALAFQHHVGTKPAHIIARVTGAPVHVAVLFGDTALEAMEPHGVREVPTAQLLSWGRWHVVPVPTGDPAAALTFARSELGAKYDWLGVLWAWWAGAQGRNGSTSRWFCSEFAAAVLAAGGVRLAVKRPAYYTPRRLYNVVQPWVRAAAD
jgi:hypothetical protein